MNYIITNMNDEILKEIISWKYEGKYSEYNMDSYEKLQERGSSIIKTENSFNYLCYFKDNELVGYTNTFKKSTGDIFLGIGLAPKLCGKGLGKEILQNSIKEAKLKYPNSKVTLQVRAWNKRAIKCYKNSGFRIVKKESVLDHNGKKEEFIFMEYIL